MKKILMALDHSPLAKNIAAQGHAYCNADNNEIIALHVIDNVMEFSSLMYDPVMGFRGFDQVAFSMSNPLSNIENEANKFLQQIKIQLKGHEIKTIIKHGKIVDTILETAEKEMCQLIMIGIRRRRSSGEIIIGKTAYNLIKRSTIPILILPIKRKNH